MLELAVLGGDGCEGKNIIPGHVYLPTFPGGGATTTTTPLLLQALAELGIVFFLFEMGLELSVERLFQMRRDVFGLGMAQFGLSAVSIFLISRFLGLTAAASIVVGGALALSSSAFVLQLLRDKGSLGTRHGRASFGILLFQDLAVVPLLVITPLLAAGGGATMAWAMGWAACKAAVAFGLIVGLGPYVLDRSVIVVVVVMVVVVIVVVVVAVIVIHT